MKLGYLKTIVEVLPKAELKICGSVIMIYDTEGEAIGDINFYENSITFYKNYTHAEAIAKKIEAKEGTLFDRELQRTLLYED